MKRFIDLRGQIYCDDDLPLDQQQPVFAFYCTVVDKFEEHSGSQEWVCWHDFERDFQGGDLARYRGLCPAWIFKEEKK